MVVIAALTREIDAPSTSAECRLVAVESRDAATAERSKPLEPLQELNSSDNQ
jgi:hypothetical protein